jgi:hypothetical protein
MIAGDAAAYEQLAESFELELELIGQGRLDERAQLAAERATLIASLPAEPPADAAQALKRAAIMQKRLTVEIVRRRTGVLLELAQLERVRRAAHGYAAGGRRRSRVQASA